MNFDKNTERLDHHNQFQGINHELLFMDSQRKASAPTAHRQGHPGFQSSRLTETLKTQLKHHGVENFIEEVNSQQERETAKELLTITIEVGNGQ